MTGERQAWFWVAGTIVVIGLLFVFRSILLPFVAGMAVAYLLDPIVDRLQTWKLGRAVATSITLLLFFVLAVSAFLLLAPVLQAQIVDFSARLPGLLEGLHEQLSGLLEMAADRLSVEDMERLRAMAGDLAGNALAFLGNVISGVWSGGLALLNLLALIFITPIVAFYLLRDWDRIIAVIDGWLPLDHAEDIRTLVREADGLLAGFVRGVLSVCLILGVLYGLALTLIGLDFGLAIGLAAGLVSFIPFFGALFGFVVGVGLALTQFADWLPIGLVAGVFVVGQILEGNALTPKLVGDRIGLHPVWVIFALMAAGVVFGFVGLLLALPIAVVVGVLVRFGLERYRKSRLFLGTGSDGP